MEKRGISECNVTSAPPTVCLHPERNWGCPMEDGAATKFDVARAAEYERQSRIGLAGYEACRELAACLLSAVLGMLDQAMGRLESLGIASRVDRVLGYVRDLPPHNKFDGATLIGVLHHLPGKAAKEMMLQEIAQRLPPGAPPRTRTQPSVAAGCRLWPVRALF